MMIKNRLKMKDIMKYHPYLLKYIMCSKNVFFLAFTSADRSAEISKDPSQKTKSAKFLKKFGDGCLKQLTPVSKCYYIKKHKSLFICHQNQ